MHGVEIPQDLYDELNYLGLIPNGTRSINIGASNYSDHLVQPWSIIQDWGLDYWSGDIIKRVLRTKSTDSKILDFTKIKHICDEKIRQLNLENKGKK